MAQARLTYFSGTGNTRWAAGRLGAGLRDAGYDVLSVEVGAPPEGAPGDRRRRPRRERTSGPARDVELEVFLFPVYAFAVPRLFRRALARLPRVPQQKAAVVGVYGNMYFGRPKRRRLLAGYEGGALVEARRVLERRGYSVFASRVLGLPVSWTQLASAPPPEEQRTIVAQAESEIAAMAKELARREGGHRAHAPAHWLWNLPVRALFRRVGRRVMGKFYVADASCSGCGKCARECPTSDIRIRGGRPRWGWRCEACQRCINGCPRSAIQTSPARALLLTTATVLPYNRVFHLEGLWGRIGFLGEWGSRGFWVGAWIVCAVVATVALDALLFAAEGPLAVRKVLAWGHTRRFPRYQGPAASGGRVADTSDAVSER
jgi:NAD-dependent dihydropyrimidine dehydrogenase PreA subunit